jgi:hypothetical protein
VTGSFQAQNDRKKFVSLDPFIFFFGFPGKAFPFSWQRITTKVSCWVPLGKN